MPKNKPDPRFSLQDYQGIIHVCEDTLDSYRNGQLEKKDVDAIISIVTASRQTLTDKNKYSKSKNPAMKADQEVLGGVTNRGPFNVFAGGVK